LLAAESSTPGDAPVQVALAVEPDRMPPATPPAATTSVADEHEDDADYDPLQPFNERMFWFNHDVLDRFLVKPVARGWKAVLPDVARRGVARVFDNVDMPRRLVNNLLQARFLGAGRELARFVVNTTVGIAGVLDVATRLHVAASDADMGQTLGVYGVGAGPYLVLPTLPPLTFRDGIGYGIDGLLDPLSYVLPFVAGRVRSVVGAVNERSLNLQLYQDAEDGAFDLYSAARNGYLQHRRAAIRSAAAERQGPALLLSRRD
jgi:phospholipid-binding lipoprotein MlaA